MAKAFDRGDIVHLNCDPSAGHEMSGWHYALVISPRDFNRLGLHLVCPISQGPAYQARNAGFLVTLMGAGTEVQGNIHVHQVRSLDLAARDVRFKERAPREIVEEVLDILTAVLV
ncbi:MAG TPA: type II toxin-antitoxin system PemK/MazF family toxin [Clostridia bacterium]|nr:type II toxin-antitoxin system PemK/MazF family toxin [Clostridia bacterium]